MYSALESAAATLGRTVNPTLYQPGELAKRIAQDNAFVTHVLQQPKIWLITATQAVADALQERLS